MLWRQTALAGVVLAFMIVAVRRPERAAPPPLQAAVLRDGFAVLEGYDPHHLHELDEAGSLRESVTVRELPRGTRVVGLTSGVGVVWRTGKQMSVAPVDDDGELGEPQRFGKSVARVCEGTATNEHRFGVAWLERDGSMWFVGGPTARDATALPAAPDRNYCAIASAGRKVALIWRDGKSVELNLCDRKCASRIVKVKIDGKRPILGVACTAEACAFAQRGDGAIAITWVTLAGKQVWSKPLPDAAPTAPISLVGAGARVAIVYGTGGEPAVRAADAGGGLTAIWQGRADGLPALAWAGGKLLVARTVDGELVTSLR